MRPEALKAAARANVGMPALLTFVPVNAGDWGMRPFSMSRVSHVLLMRDFTQIGQGVVQAVPIDMVNCSRPSAVRESEGDPVNEVVLPI